MDHSTRVAGYLAMIPDRSRSLSQPRRNLRHRQHLPLVKRVETVDEYPPARYAIPVVPGRRIVDGPNVDDDDVAYTVLAEGSNWCVVHVPAVDEDYHQALARHFLPCSCGLSCTTETTEKIGERSRTHGSHCPTTGGADLQASWKPGRIATHNPIDVSPSESA
jgi:hypothetical protein